MYSSQVKLQYVRGFLDQIFGKPLVSTLGFGIKNVKNGTSNIAPKFWMELLSLWVQGIGAKRSGRIGKLPSFPLRWTMPLFNFSNPHREIL